MNIGIKYCGGCNSRYNRAAAVRKVIDSFPQHTFIYATQGASLCDIWLIVCGCITACASTEGLTATKKIFKINSPQGFVEVVSFLKQPDNNLTKTSKQIFKIGESVCLTKIFSKNDIFDFTRLTSNYPSTTTTNGTTLYNELNQLVVPELLIASFIINAVLKIHFPCKGTLLISEQLNFNTLALGNEPISINVTLNTVTETRDYYIGQFACSCQQDNHIVADGLYCLKLIKNFYILE